MMEKGLTSCNSVLRLSMPKNNRPYGVKTMTSTITLERFNELWDKLIEREVIFIDANNNARKGHAINIWEDKGVVRVTVVLPNGDCFHPSYDRVGVSE